MSLLVSSQESMNVLNELLELIEADVVYRRGHLEISVTPMSKAKTYRIDLIVPLGILCTWITVFGDLNLTILHFEDMFRIRHLQVNIERELDIDIFVGDPRRSAEL